MKREKGGKGRTEEFRELCNVTRRNRIRLDDLLKVLTSSVADDEGVDGRRVDGWREREKRKKRLVSGNSIFSLGQSSSALRHRCSSNFGSSH